MKIVTHVDPVTQQTTTTEEKDLYETAKTAVTILGVVTVGAAAAVQYRKQKVTEEEAEADLDARYSERLTKAIEHLGNKESVTIRKGAIYELKRLAIDSEKDRESVVKILASFVREGVEALSDAQKQRMAEGKEPDKQPRPGSDVFEASYVLEFLHIKFLELYKLKMTVGVIHDLCLDNAYLGKIWLKDAILEDGSFKEAKLNGAHFEKARLRGIELDRAKLCGAYFQSARLDELTFEKTDLFEAHLEGIDAKWIELKNANLCAAYLRGAILFEAHLEGADLRGAQGLTAEQLRDAHLDKTTQLDNTLRDELRAMGKDV